MRLSRQQKVYLAILALALGTLLVGRHILSRQPAPAARCAGISPATTSQGLPRHSDGGVNRGSRGAESHLLPRETTAGKMGLPDPNSQDPRIKLAQRLEILWPDEYLTPASAGTRDAFSLPAAWLSELCAQNPLVEGDAAAQFAKSHQLNAVLIEEKMRSALVDGHLLIPGQELDGFKLIAIDESSATFATGTKLVILKLKRDR